MDYFWLKDFPLASWNFLRLHDSLRLFLFKLPSFLLSYTGVRPAPCSDSLPVFSDSLPIFPHRNSPYPHRSLVYLISSWHLLLRWFNQHTWSKKTDGKMEFWVWFTHFQVGKDYSLLGGMWSVNSPWHTVVVQLLNISLEVAQENFLLRGLSLLVQWFSHLQDKGGTMHTKVAELAGYC